MQPLCWLSRLLTTPTVPIARRGRRPAVERLEDRAVPTATADPLFGVGGQAVIDVDPAHLSSAKAVAAVALPGGKLLVAGSYNRQFAVYRITAKGALDTSFGGGDGIATGLFGPDSQANALVVQADAKIVAAGYRTIEVRPGDDLDRDAVVVRLNADGTTDSGFAGFGFINEDFGASGRATGVGLQGSQIVVGGSNSSNKFAAWPYHSNGVRDMSFGTAGVATISTGASSDFAQDLAVQADGMIVLAGYSVDNRHGAVARLTRNGAPDTTFGGGDGITSAGAPDAGHLTLAPGGKIVVAPTANVLVRGQFSSIAVLGFNADGSPDTGFDGDGVLNLDLGPGFVGLTGLAATPDGKLFLAAYTSGANTADTSVLLRRNADGSPDTIFATDGKLTLPAGAGLDRSLGPIAFGYGRLSAAGTVNTPAGGGLSDTDLFLARYIYNVAPTARADNASTNEDTPVKLNVLANDSVELGETKTLTFIQAPSASVGTVVRFDKAGTLLFTPAPNFAGTAVFQYTVSDNNGGSASASVTINVRPVNDAPINSGPKAASVLHDGVLAFTGPRAIRVSDIDAGSANLQVVLSCALGKLYVSNTTGLASASGSGSTIVTLVGKLSGLNGVLAGLVFRPTPGQAGNGRVTVTTYDLGNTGAGGSRYDQDVIPIAVRNAKPAFAAKFTVLPEYLALAGATLTVPKAGGVLAHVTDADGDRVTARLAYASPIGKLRLAADGSFTYLAPAGFKGVFVFVLNAYDGIALSDPIIAVIRVG